MKIREVRQVMGGIGGYIRQTRVRTLAKGEPLPEKAIAVDDDTPDHDWKVEVAE